MTKKGTITILTALLIVPMITHASWWNPFSWNWFGLRNETELQVEAPVTREETPVNTQAKVQVKTSDSYCTVLYNDLLSKYGQNYDSCAEGLTFSAGCGSASGGEITYDKINIAVVLDASGSMNGLVSGTKKIDIAKKAITDFVASLPKDVNVSLIVYGHKGSNTEQDKVVSCASTETIYPLSALSPGDFTSKVNSFSPKGWTPLASAIKRAEGVLSVGGVNNKNIIYVVSDGLETCGGDPAAVAREVNESDSKVEVNIIGFAVTNEEQSKLKEAAVSGGGKFYVANSSSDLNKVFSDSKENISNICSGAVKGRLMIEYGSLTGRSATCFASKTGRETIDLTVAFSKLKGQDQVCVSEMNQKQQQRQKTVEQIEDSLRSQNLDSFNKLFGELKKDI